MKRYANDKLKEWKNSKRRKPLIINGARQVGKTWLMKHFGENCFENTAYIDCTNNLRMNELFSGDMDTLRIIEGLHVESGIKISPQSTLIVLDEIQEIPNALTSLKYFYDNSPEYAIIAGGSLLGVALHEGTSFPVGKVEFLDLYPFTFCEFLEAIGEQELAALLLKRDWEMVSAFSNKYIDYLRKFYYIGGMPECIKVYSQDRDYAEVRRVQESIILAYERDFSKHVQRGLLPKVRILWEKLPQQLSRENKNFSPGIIKKGSRMKDYEDALEWLTDAGLVYKTEHIGNPAVPLKNYADGPFKLYVCDVGLLSCMAELDAKTLLEGNSIFTEYKGSLTENYVCQELIAYGRKPYYWGSEHTAEVDFVFRHGNGILPLEVKAEENLQAKSLKVYSKKYNPTVALRTSMRNYREDGWLTNIPLYGIGVWD